MELHTVPVGDTLAQDVREGLARPVKELPPKHFYDARGSELFEQITALPEYYPTRAEREILLTHAGDVAAATQATELVELGPGSAEKTVVLLRALAGGGALRRYVPVDVSEAAVHMAAANVAEELPDLPVQGLVGDFERDLGRLPEPDGRRLVAFLGGTLGNFRPEPRRRFLAAVAEHLGPDGRLLVGVDLVKDPAVIEAAYDDGQGVTAEFNRNVLHVINRELGADFDPDAFDHVALFDPEHEWIEMRLRARAPQTVRIPALEMTVTFAAGEELRTEISAKFTPRRLECDLAAAGLRLAGWWTDPRERFALALARTPGAAA